MANDLQIAYVKPSLSLTATVTLVQQDSSAPHLVIQLILRFLGTVSFHLLMGNKQQVF
jgi:hypothetical protein